MKNLAYNVGTKILRVTFFKERVTLSSVVGIFVCNVVGTEKKQNDILLVG